MNIYDIAMMPLEAWVLKKMRSAIIPRAYGDVLEAGIGTELTSDIIILQRYAA